MLPPDEHTLPSSEIADVLAGTAYRTIGVLGQGGMGQVLDAEHTALARRVVVKVVRGDTTVPQGEDRLRLEAQALARLEHPHLVRVLDFGVTRGARPFLVLERLSGHTLHDEIQARGPLPWEEAARYARQALGALDEAHRAGLVHRDVKLQNIQLCEPRRPGEARFVKLLDFGIAKVVHGAGGNAPAPLLVPTEQGLIPGTPKFFSPEQAMGMAVDARTDVYAMGVVLFHLLVGHGPFPRAKDAVQAALAHVRERPVPPSAFSKQPIPPALDAVVLRALAKRPEERFATAADMEAALASVAPSPAVPVASSPVAPSPVAPPGKGEQGTSRHSLSPEPSFLPSMLVLAGAVLCSAATTLALLWWLR